MYKMRTVVLKLNSEFHFTCIVVYSIRYATLYKYFKSPVITAYTTRGAAQGGRGLGGVVQQTRQQREKQNECVTRKHFIFCFKQFIKY